MFDNLIDAIFPPRCAVCDEVLPVGRKGICDFCRGRLSYITEPRCLKCGKEIPVNVTVAVRRLTAKMMNTALIAAKI